MGGGGLARARFARAARTDHGPGVVGASPCLAYPRRLTTSQPPPSAGRGVIGPRRDPELRVQVAAVRHPAHRLRRRRARRYGPLLLRRRQARRARPSPLARRRRRPDRLLNLRSGPNGLFTAGIAAHAAALLVDRLPVYAGLVGALGTFKPHLALDIPALLAARRENRGLLAFVVASLVLVVASLIEFGTSAWVAFGQASAFTARNLAEGTYPLARFSSVYAAAFGAGLRGATAMGVHLAVLAIVTVSSVLVARRTTDRRAVVAVALTWWTFVSPYAYDYDMALLVVVAVLLSGASVRVLGREASANLLPAILLVQFTGFVWWTFNGTGGVTAYVLAALFVVVLWGVHRDRSHVAVDVAADAARVMTASA